MASFHNEDCTLYSAPNHNSVLLPFQLSFGSFHPILSDNGQFSSLYNIAPKDTSLALGMVSLMVHFRWTWVGLIISESQKGFQFLSDMKGEMNRNGICAAFVEIISSIYSLILNIPAHMLQPREVLARVVVIFFERDVVTDFRVHMENYLVTWIVWVTNSQWHADHDGKNFILDSYHGTLVFTNHHNEISDFRSFTQTINPSKYPEDKFLAFYWCEHFNCSLSGFDYKLKNCPPNASLAWLPINRLDPTMSDSSYNIYNAVYAVAHSLHKMLLQRAELQPMAEGDKVVFSPWQVNVSFIVIMEPNLKGSMSTQKYS